MGIYDLIHSLELQLIVDCGLTSVFCLRVLNVGDPMALLCSFHDMYWNVVESYLYFYTTFLLLPLKSKYVSSFFYII